MTDDRIPPTPSPFGRRIRRFMSDYPLVPLLILLVLLVVVLQLLRPGIVNERWIANTVKFAIPLAMLAGCQTMTMLTGGIDLSVGTVATMAAFIMATQAVQPRPGGGDPASPWRRRVLIGLANGIGVGVFRVHPLIMTLGTEPDRHRLPAGLPAHGDRHRLRGPRLPRLARHRPHLGRAERAAPLRAARGAATPFRRCLQ